MTENTPAAPSWLPIAGILAGSGTIHLVAPKPYEALIPEALGDPQPWIFWSGVIELALAAGLALPRTRKVAALGSAALFVGVLPGNLTMTSRAMRSRRASTTWKAATVARLPLQLPLITRALRIARSAAR